VARRAARFKTIMYAFRDARKHGHALPIEDANVAAPQIGERVRQGIAPSLRIARGQPILARSPVGGVRASEIALHAGVESWIGGVRKTEKMWLIAVCTRLFGSLGN